MFACGQGLCSKKQAEADRFFAEAPFCFAGRHEGSLRSFSSGPKNEPFFETLWATIFSGIKPCAGIGYAVKADPSKPLSKKEQKAEARTLKQAQKIKKKADKQYQKQLKKQDI